jgi:DNA-binding CsgD family transcriptional regulator
VAGATAVGRAGRRGGVFSGWSLEMDKSLVASEPPVLGQARYRMLDTIREYAAGLLADAGESAAFELRLREYSLQTAERNLAIGMARVPASWAARVDTFRRYDVEAGNLAHVLDWCLAHSDAETGLRMCAAVSPCWIVWGTFAEGREWLDPLLALAAASDVPAGVRGAATVVRAQLATSSDPAAAEPLARAGLPPLPGARAERYLAPARRLGDAAVARLWARGLALTSEDAVALALEEERPEGESPALSVVETYEVAAAPPSSLTRREQQVAALIAAGHSNKEIAAELSISPTTAARHVANILAKLGFRSRTQIAAWVADQQ